jgi:O-acetyl-ADP-ribose deacetylase (regulator of RNase III)
MDSTETSIKQSSRNLVKAQFENQTLELFEGRIQSQKADVVVSPDNNYLTHGSGASEALWSSAGSGLTEWWDGVKHEVRLSLGDVLVSGGFNLEARYMLHAVTVDFDANRRLRPLDARILYRAIFDKAAELGAETLALPLLGAGGGDLGCELSATALLQAVARRASQRTVALRVRVVESNREAFLKVAQIVKQESDRRLSLTSLLKALAQKEEAGKDDTTTLDLWLSEEDPAKAIALCFESLANQIPEEVKATPQLGEKRGTPRDLQPAIRAAIHSGSGARNSFLHNASLEASLESRYVHIMYDACFVLSLYLTNPEKLREILHAGDGRLHQERTRTEESLYPKTEEEKQKEWLGEDFEAVARAEGVDEDYIARADSKPLRLKSLKSQAVLKEDSGCSSSIASDHGRHDDAHCKYLQYMRGTRGVRGLHSLLMGEMVSDEMRDALHERAQIEGYRGTREDVLLEVCVEEPDLVNFLVSEFARYQLRMAYEEKSGTKIDATVKAEEIAKDFLEILGFSKISRIRGLTTCADVVRRAGKKMKFSHEVRDIAGCVNEGAKEIEFLISSYIRFLTQAIFQKPPEVFLKVRSGSSPSLIIPERLWALR